MTTAPRYAPTYPGQTKGIPEWMKKAGTYTHTYGGGPNAETEIKYDPSRVGNIDWEKEQEGAYGGLAGASAYDQASREMFPRSNYDAARQDLIDANLKTMGAFDYAQAGLSDILGYGRRKAERFGTDELARRKQEEMNTGLVTMGGTRTDPGQRRLDELDSRHAQQMMNVHFKRGEATAAHGQSLAGLSSRQADMENRYTDQLMARYDRQQQLKEQEKRWKDEMTFKATPTTSRVTKTDRWGRPAGSTTTTSGRPGYLSSLQRRMYA